MSAADQQAYHDGMFLSLQNWGETHAKIIDLTGDTTRAGLLALDQLGHFGSHGADLVVEAVRQHRATSDPLTLLELGCGYGGVLRHITNRLGEDGTAVRGFGVDLVAAHTRPGLR